MTRAIMNGCNGKMGQCITGICAQDEDIEIVAGIDTYDGIKNDYPVFASLKECTVDADVIIDFPMQKQWMRCLHMVWKTDSDRALYDRTFRTAACRCGKSIRKVAILKSANMSLGINTLMELLKKLRRYLRRQDLIWRL